MAYAFKNSSINFFFLLIDKPLWFLRSLESLEVIANLIANATTQKGLVIKAKADENKYEKELKVDDEALTKTNLTGNGKRMEL